MSQLYNVVRELIHPSEYVCVVCNTSYLTSKISAVKWQLSETLILGHKNCYN